MVKGRRLLVEFTCSRCGAVEYAPYMDIPNYSATHNVRVAAPPEGWQSESIFKGTPQLCPKCYTAYKAFIGMEDDNG